MLVHLYNHVFTGVQLRYCTNVQGDATPARLTGAACRAARALLKWSMRDLASQSGVSLPTILKLENDGQVTEDTADKIRAAFERHGVEITNGNGTGARLRNLPT